MDVGHNMKLVLEARPDSPSQITGHDVIPEEALQQPMRISHDHQQVYMFGPCSKNLEDTISELEKSRNMQSDTISMAGTLEDTNMLWMAWKLSVIETVGRIFEGRCAVLVQKHSSSPATAMEISVPRQRLLDVLAQLHATMTMWRDHLQFLIQKDEKIQASLARQHLNVKQSQADLKQKVVNFRQTHRHSRALGRIEVLMVTATSINDTYAERRRYHQESLDLDRYEHIEQARGLIRSLGLLLTGFEQDMAGLKRQSAETIEQLDDSMRGKQKQWMQRCDALTETYTRTVHKPLRALMEKVRAQPMSTTHGGDAAAKAPLSMDMLVCSLDSQNDPQCVRRCELAMQELLTMKTYLRQVVINTSSTPVLSSTSNNQKDALDDEDLQAAKEKRHTEMQEAEVEHARRLTAVEEECKALVRTRDQAVAYMASLKQQAANMQQKFLQDMVRARTHPPSNPTNPTSSASQNHRIAAAITRTSSARQEALNADMLATEARINDISARLSALQKSQTGSDFLRLSEVLLAHTSATYALCRRLKNQFQLAIEQEESLRRIIQTQLSEALRRLQQSTANVMQRMSEASQSHFRQIKVRLAALQDRISESTRRIDGLESARRTQQTVVDGQEVSVYTSLEEYMQLMHRYQEDMDTGTRVRGMITICRGALALMQELSSLLHGI